MKLAVVTIVFGYVLLKSSCDEDMDNYSELLKYHRLKPRIGDCYEIYYPNETVTPLNCQRPTNYEKQSCIEMRTEDDKYCFGIKTPTNETVQFLCENSLEEIFSYHGSYELNDCFNVSGSDKKYQKVCQQEIGNYSVGVTTPDNFTILFDSYFCTTLIRDKNKKMYAKFVETYTFEPDTKSCFKIYDEHQYISPYTCLNPEIFITCVEKLPQNENCEGIVTQNNETIILQCKNDKTTSKNCFEIYTSDGNRHISCQKKLEQRCVGFTTPSNLTVLLECYFCKHPSGSDTTFDVEEQKKLRRFIKTYLSNEYLGNNSYINISEFSTFYQNQSKSQIPNYYGESSVDGAWLSNNTCYGFTLESNETVVLECPSNITRRVEPGCFRVISPKMDMDQTVCTKILDEQCVGITTPMNWSVAFDCYFRHTFSDSEGAYYEKFTLPLPYTSPVAVEYKGRRIEVDVWHNKHFKLYPALGKCFEVYDPSEMVTAGTCQRPLNLKRQACINLSTESDKYCFVLKTPSNETIEILCENWKEKLLSFHEDDDLNNCFNISKPGASYVEVCQKTFSGLGTGLTTPDNFTILLSSSICSPAVDEKDREKYSSFIKTYSFDPDTKSCFKIYYQHQLVSPYTCLDPEILGSCVQKLSQNENCEGVVTPNNETVVIQCTVDREIPKNCFEIYTADGTRHISCQKKVEERCIGITTPSNLTVLLECYFCQRLNVEYEPYNLRIRVEHRNFVKTYITNGYSGKNSYLHKLQFGTFKQNHFKPEKPDYSGRKSVVYGYWLPNSTCYGFTLESGETVVLECIDSTKYVDTGCFTLVNTKMETERTVCLKILNEQCVGVTTSTNWSIALECYTVVRQKFSNILRWRYIEHNNARRFQLRPILNSCYEVYPSQEINRYSCRKNSKPENYACIDWIPGKNHCLGLNITKNETIELVCGDSSEEVLSRDIRNRVKSCFNLYNPTGKIGKVCQKNFGNYSIGLTSPSNHSILLSSFFCTPYKTLDQIQEYKNFISNFKFDPSVRSCYKVYTQDQEINPYTCLSEEVYDACVHPIDGADCLGITTQNNETVVLECKDNKSVNETGCFEIYSPDKKRHIACQKQLEERCMGIVTPSNLTVLLECYTCESIKGGASLLSYTNRHRKQFRQVVENALYNFTHKAHQLEESGVQVLRAYPPQLDIKFSDCEYEREEYNFRMLPGHQNCLGITMGNFETIVLECPGRIPNKIGCYDVFSPVHDTDHGIIAPERKIANVCVKTLNEWCVGIRTPKNWTITLSCYKLAEGCRTSVLRAKHNGPPPRE